MKNLFRIMILSMVSLTLMLVASQQWDESEQTLQQTKDYEEQIPLQTRDYEDFLDEADCGTGCARTNLTRIR